MNVVITGSLGHIGKPLVTNLVQQGHAVTVISSHPDRQKEIEALGATSAIGSLEDVDFVISAFAGADAVFTMVPPNFQEVDQVSYYSRIATTYAHAITQAGITRVVNLSSYGAHLNKGTGFILGAHYVEAILDKLTDVSMTHLRAGYFYYNLFGVIGMIKHAGFIGANYGGEDKMALVSPVDIAAVSAEELLGNPIGRTIRYVASDERTASEVAHRLGVAIGKPDLQWLVLTSDQMKEGLERSGFPPHVVTNFVELGASLHSGALLEDYENHRPTLGNVKLDDFAKDFAAVYQNS